MRVLIATSSFARWPGDPIAAHGNALYDLVSELGKHIGGTVITHAGRDAPETEQLGDLLVRRVQPERPETALHKALVGPQAPRVIRSARAMRKAVMAAAPDHDVAHGFWFFPGGWSVSRLPMPKIMTLPGPDIHLFPRYPVVGTAIRRTVKMMDACVAVDTLGRDVLMGMKARRVEYIPSPIKLDSFPRVPAVGEPRLVYVGRLAKEKGVDVLLEALAIARMSRPDMTLEVVGDGPERAALTDRAGTLGVSHAVTWLGAQGQPQVAAAIARAGALVLPSRREGLPSAALEALSSGRPVIASAVGGLPGLLEGGRGSTVAVEDPKALAEALLDGFSRSWDQGLLCSTAAGFAVEGAARKYLDLYASMVDEKEAR